MERDKKLADKNRAAERVAKLVDLVDYQDGSVISRIIIKGEAGGVTLFAFDEEQGLSEHTAPFDALAHILDGETEITIAGTPFRVKEGEMLIMPANKPHSLRALKKFKMILTMIKK